MTSRCFRPRCCFYHQPIAWVLGETLEAAQRGAARVTAEYEPLPAILTIEQAIEAGSFLTDELRIVDGDIGRARREPASHRRRAQDRRAGTFLSGDAGGHRVDRRGGIHRRPLVDAASVRDAGGGRARARRASQPCDRRVPADGRRVRRQGSAGQSVCGDRRARRVEDEAARARQADARARHRDHGQTPSVSREIRRGVLVGWPFERAARRAVFRRRLEPRSVRARSCGARCFTSTTRTSCRPSR